MMMPDNTPNTDTTSLQTPPSAPAVPPQKTRRVGTFTMALCLIVTGVLLLLRIVVPTLNFSLILRFAPVVLILLGIEILVANFMNKGEKLKYDFLSVVVCLLLIFASLTAAVVPQWVYNERRAYEQSRVMTQELTDRTLDALVDRKDIYSIEAYISVDSVDYTDDLTLDTLRSIDYIQTRVYFTGEFESVSQFTQACYEVLQVLKEQAPHIDYASFHSSAELNEGSAHLDEKYGDMIFSLWLDGAHQINWTAAEMEQNVQVYHWWQDEDGEEYYITFEDYEYRQEAAAQEAAASAGEGMEPDDMDVPDTPDMSGTSEVSSAA